MLHIPSLPSNLHSCFCHFHLPSPSLSVFQASFSLPSHVSHHLHSFSFPPYLYTTQPSLFSGLSCALGSFPTPFSLFYFSPRLPLYRCYYFFFACPVSVIILLPLLWQQILLTIAFLLILTSSPFKIYYVWLVAFCGRHLFSLLFF